MEETKEGLISARATYTNYELLNISKIAHAGSPIFMLLALGYVFKIRIIFLEDSNYLKEKLQHLLFSKSAHFVRYFVSLKIIGCREKRCTLTKAT